MESKRHALEAYLTWMPDYCKHCFTCVNICPTKNLEFNADDDMISLGKCIQCQLCEKYCPDFAIESLPKKK
jgi:formate hydrogenlyase subunit 6/NADH:ubiquinone oxidoreductase subunit I